MQGREGNNRAEQFRRSLFVVMGYADVCQGTSRGTARRSKMAPDLVNRPAAGHRLGKTRSLTVRGGEVTADEARAMGKHPLPISPSRSRFALFRLCRFGRPE